MSHSGFVVWFTGLSGSGKWTLAAMLAGGIKTFTGVDDPYEAPTQADVVVETDKETKEQSLAKILGKLEELGFVHRAVSASGGAVAAAKKLILPHGGELVDRWAHGAE